MRGGGVRRGEVCMGRWRRVCVGGLGGVRGWGVGRLFVRGVRGAGGVVGYESDDGGVGVGLMVVGGLFCNGLEKT